VSTDDRQEQLALLERMLRIRLFEERTIQLHSAGRIPGAIHTSIGQEAAVVGACSALRTDDYITGTHRSHAHPIAKGAELGPLMAELFGKETGICGGKGGSMHLADFRVGSLGETAIVGSALPVAVGAGLSARMRRSDQVCLSFFGDGAANTGAFHEALNLASVWELPVVFFCENNQYALTTSARYATPVEDIASRGAAYRMPGVVVDGQDVLAVREAVVGAAGAARSGRGPSLVEAKTYRFREHAELGGVDLSYYRSSEEISRWRERDPIILYEKQLIESGLATPDDSEELRTRVADEVEQAVEFATKSPFPGPDQLYAGLFSEPTQIR
jgi:pyruvate dehydrogenase E1 component alpha subunit